MEKPRKCEKGFNLRRVGAPEKKLRMLCLFAENRELIKQLLHECGGQESSGICSEHYEYAQWHTNQPPTEEELQRQEKFEKMKEEAMRRAGLL